MKILAISCILLIFCACSTEHSTANYLQEQIDSIDKKRFECDLPPAYKLHNSALYIFKNSSQSTNVQCHNNIHAISCDEIAKMETIEAFEAIEGCFQFPKHSKKEICIKNIALYCERSYTTCKSGTCEEIISSVNERGNVFLDESKLESYCESTINGDQEPSGSGDVYDFACKDHPLDCSESFDFRDDSWKSNCTSK